ncbi:sensor histidine kinase [Acrocarpospora catenulata]|uniref:sensor histidine kinase n=1 Tax=Acrocarpospora catenulata TaxID=2836182 RepID=UPI001BDAB6E2|nr:histidine kinase [Acrocarpospora catenulata]
MGDTFISWLRRLSEFALLGLVALILLLDTVFAIPRGGVQAVLTPAAGLVGLVAVLLRRRSQTAAMVTVLVASLLVTAVAAKQFDIPAMAEGGALMVLTISVLRWVRPLGKAIALAVAALITLQLAAGLRVRGFADPFELLFFAGWLTATAIGGYLRLQRVRREAAVEAVRRAERLDLARELHDLVAHHITGIVVQAQAARTVAEMRPDAVLPALDAIATAGSEALTSMRRLVGVLRDDTEASRSPGVTLADLRALVERFSTQGPKATFDIGHGVTDLALPPEVRTALHRVLQESLTNIRRHAPGAAWVEATLSAPTGRIRLRVRNPGSPSDPGLSRLGGGFGLVGMAERVRSLGGSLIAGPDGDGVWEVTADFPLPARPQ